MVLAIKAILSVAHQTVPMSGYSAPSESKPTKHVLLYRGGCGACSKVAELVTDLRRTDLEARAIESETVQQVLTSSGLESPSRPTLLLIGPSGTRALVGWAMRRRLAGLLGWRQAHVIMRLSAAELRAQTSKRLTADARLWPQRRRLLKLGVGLPIIAAGIAATGSEALAVSQEPHPAGRNCLVVYECGYSVIAAGGKVYFCETFCDIVTGVYCFEECYLCG
jgi:hypothetical protein